MGSADEKSARLLQKQSWFGNDSGKWDVRMFAFRWSMVSVSFHFFQETNIKAKPQNQWHSRATVAESLGSKFIVKYCDIGDLDSIDDIKRFRTLPNEYRDLPKMAIKARLYGIQPIDVSGWDMNDTIQFGQLVTGKKFQAVIGKIIENENPDENAILEIQLIDVSTEYDVCINDNFVSSGRALNIFTY